ncbi:MAG: hypothetical protein KBD46_01735 [Candidatus Levybacteria bacterium]|nr:hypothetical protein [Candidatus Levybacteria bacterium]
MTTNEGSEMATQRLHNRVQAFGFARYILRTAGQRKKAINLTIGDIKVTPPVWRTWWRFQITTSEGKKETIVVFADKSIYTYTH